MFYQAQGHVLTNYTHNCEKCDEQYFAVRDSAPHLDHFLYRVYGVERSGAKIVQLGWIWRFSNEKFRAYARGGINLKTTNVLCLALSAIYNYRDNRQEFVVPKDQKFLHVVYSNL